MVDGGVWEGEGVPEKAAVAFVVLRAPEHVPPGAPVRGPNPLPPRAQGGEPVVRAETDRQWVGAPHRQNGAGGGGGV